MKKAFLAGFFTFLVTFNLFAFQNNQSSIFKSKSLVISSLDRKSSLGKTKTAIIINSDSLRNFEKSFGEKLTVELSNLNIFKNVSSDKIKNEYTFYSQLISDGNEQFIINLPSQNTSISFNQTKPNIALLIEDIVLNISTNGKDSTKYNYSLTFKSAFWNVSSKELLWGKFISTSTIEHEVLSLAVFTELAPEIAKNLVPAQQIETTQKEVEADENKNRPRLRISLLGTFNFHVGISSNNNNNTNIPTFIKETEKETPNVNNFYSNVMSLTPTVEFFFNDHFGIFGEYHKETLDKGGKDLLILQEKNTGREYTPDTQTLSVSSLGFGMVYMFDGNNGFRSYLRGKISSRSYSGRFTYSGLSGGLDAEFEDVISPGISFGFTKLFNESKLGICGELGFDYGSTTFKSAKNQYGSIQIPEIEIQDSRFYLKLGLLYDFIF